MPEFKNDLFVSCRRPTNAGHDKWVDALGKELRGPPPGLVGCDVRVFKRGDSVDVTPTLGGADTVVHRELEQS